MTTIEKRIIALFSNTNRSIAQETELKNLMRNGATASAEKVKVQKEKRAFQLEKANKKVLAIIRECAKEIQSVYDENDICADKRNLNFSYSAKATAKPSTKFCKSAMPLIQKRKKVVSKSKDFNERATLIAKDIKNLTTSA
tara:strand:+ start:705 stop:1127 length:423 start_codon:yes stop_codon:yes gene_type:complete